jgi:tRNA threonylcarbamoyladenosine biosynthesis protein TsaE
MRREAEPRMSMSGPPVQRPRERSECYATCYDPSELPDPRVLEFTTSSDEETVALGRRIAPMLPPRAVVLLIGDLGAGKTTLAKGIISGLSAARPEDVTSPTFTLIHEYPALLGTTAPQLVYHIDLYRLDHASQVATLGLDELFDREAVVLIEWGERFPELLPPNLIRIHLDPDPSDPQLRTIQMNGLPDSFR